MLANYFVYKSLQKIHKKFKKNKEFNLKKLDLNIARIADYIYKKNKSSFFKYSGYQDNSIGTLATELYNTGGHTPCLIHFIQSFHKDYDLHCFLTKKKKSFTKTANKKIHLINDLVQIKGIDSHKKEIVQNIIDLYNLIIESKIKVLFLYIHMNDILSTAVISLLKIHTNIKIIFLNHGDHLPTLSLQFVDLILDLRPAGQAITKNKRGYKNTLLIPLQSKKVSETKYYNEKEIKDKRQELGIHDNNYFTLSGFSASKIFNKNESEYIKMIKDLLVKETRLKHVLVTNLKKKHQCIINKIFKNSKEASSRLIIIPLVAEFDILFQSCDFFIDSFPIGSALTHIDMMRNKRPTIVKINKENLLYSFEYYLPENYKYAFDNIKDMKKRILELLYNKKEQNKIANDLYNHHLKTFEFEIVKLKYKKIIESSDNLNKLYMEIN